MSDIPRKIRSLLEVAKEGSGATDAERETAAKLAKQLMAKHGLTEADVPEREVQRPQGIPLRHTVRVVVTDLSGMFRTGGFRFTTNDSTTTNGW